MVLMLAAFALVPLYCWWVDSVYPLTLFGRILVFALAALGLNLALGYGGMVSLGHAMYIGFGAYAVGIGSALGMESGVLQLLNRCPPRRRRSRYTWHAPSSPCRRSPMPD